MKCHFSLKSPSSVCHKPIGASSAVFTSSLHVELGFCFFATTSDPFIILSDSLMTLNIQGFDQNQAETNIRTF